MKRGILVGIDLGTTVFKAAAFDGRTGEALSRVSDRLKVSAFEGGLREQDPADIDRALRAGIAKLRRDVGRRWREVAGIGLCSQGGSGIIADRETGSPHTPMILWNDSRAFQYLPEIASRKSRRYWRSLSDMDLPGAGLGRILWLRKHGPELFDENNIYVGAGEYAYFRLTGVWRQDAGNALQIGCYSVPKGDLVPGPLRLVGVPLSFFAPMRKGHETHPLSRGGGRLFGLSAGIPVAGPYFDHEAGYLSAAAAFARPLQCSLGTAWVGNFVLPEASAGRSPYQLAVPSPVGKGRLVVQPLLTGNITWDWGLKRLLHRDHMKALAELPAIFRDDILPPAGLVVLPWLARPNPIDSSLFGGGTVFGIGAETGPADLVRALAAGLVCELARVFGEVRDSGVVDSVVLAGGASRGFFFRRLIASLFSPQPVFWPADEDLAGSRGAVYAFSRRAARGKTLRERRPSTALRDRARRALGFYVDVFERLYGEVPEGGPFRFEGRR